MIPRYQRILFWTLASGILLMILFLLRGCEQAHQRLSAIDSAATPIASPTSTVTEDVTLYLASDADLSITPIARKLPLPQEPTLRARTLLTLLLADYALPTSTHLLSSGPTVEDVFLLPLPNAATSEFSAATPRLAVINLNKAFVATHPSGITTEELTIQSILGTLHAALPQIMQIRFLVDGQAQDTLAGHADLSRIYVAADTTTKPTPLAVEQSNAQTAPNK